LFPFAYFVDRTRGKDDTKVPANQSTATAAQISTSQVTNLH